MQPDLLSQQTQKLLLEKNKDKSAIALAEITNKVSQAVAQKDEKSIRIYLEFFKMWILSGSQSQRKTASTVFLNIATLVRDGGDKFAQKFVKDLTNPILEIVDDKDKIIILDNLHYFGKVLNGLILINLTKIVEATINRAAESDEGIKKAYQLFDTQMKSIFNDNQPQKKYLNVEEFVVMLEAKLRMYNKQANIKSALIGWIKTIHDKEPLEMYFYLPKLAERLFDVFGDQEASMKSQVDHLLGEIQKEYLIQMKKNTFDHQITSDLIDILIRICQKDINYAKLTAIVWIYEYLRLFQQTLDQNQEYLASNLMTSSLRQVSQQDPKQSFSGLNDSEFKKVIFSKIPDILEPILRNLSHEEKEIRRAAQKTNELLLQIMDRVKDSSVEFVNLFTVVKEMLMNKNSTAEQALVWMDQLLRNFSEKLLPTIDGILQRVFDKLCDAEGTVLQNVMKVLGSISVHEKYFDLVIDKIIDVFYNNQELRKKSDQIIKKFCSLLNPVKVYTAFAAKILQRQVEEYDLGFICSLVQTLESILVTDKDLQDLRQMLRNLRYEENKQEENLNIFEALFSTFSFNPVSTITLCFLVEEYELAYNIIMSLQFYFSQNINSSEIEIDMDTLQSIAKVVNILESPIFVCNYEDYIYIFTDLRLQLLESDQHPYLLKCLYGLMMLLPQGMAFNKLRQRLKNVNQADNDEDDQSEEFQNNKKVLCQIDQQKLLNILRKTRKRVNDFKKDAEGKENYDE